MLWISFAYNADPDPPFLSQCGSRSGSREQNGCGCRSRSWSDFIITKNWIVTWKVFLKHIYLRRYKSPLKGWKSGLFVNFGQFPCSWIRISNKDPDPLQYRYGSTTMATTVLYWQRWKYCACFLAFLTHMDQYLGRARFFPIWITIYCKYVTQPRQYPLRKSS